MVFCFTTTSTTCSVAVGTASEGDLTAASGFVDRNKRCVRARVMEKGVSRDIGDVGAKRPDVLDRVRFGTIVAVWKWPNVDRWAATEVWNGHCAFVRRERKA